MTSTAWDFKLPNLKINLVWHYTKAQYFYNVKNRLSIITSKSLSKNLCNENKPWCFDVFKTKRELKWQLSGITTEILWQTFWRNNWQFVFCRCKNTALMVHQFFTCYNKNFELLFGHFYLLLLSIMLKLINLSNIQL